MILDIKKIGEKVLREKSKNVDVINKEIEDLVKNMESTLRDSKGVGLAAPQVGVLKRIILVMPEDKAYVFINPEYKNRSKEVFCDYEGCLSLPGENIKIKRSKKVTLQFIGVDGEIYEVEARNFFARIIQHEIDHLDGKLIVDYKER